jgi:hypothetical protein
VATATVDPVDPDDPDEAAHKLLSDHLGARPLDH